MLFYCARLSIQLHFPSEKIHKPAPHFSLFAQKSSITLKIKTQAQTRRVFLLCFLGFWRSGHPPDGPGAGRG